MKLSLRFIDGLIVEMTCESQNSIIIEDVSSFTGFVDTEFIEELKEIIEELETHNLQVKAKLI